MWHKLLIALASACPINPLFPLAPEYIGPKTRATLACIIDWHIKNNLTEFSALAKSVWGIYTPFNNLDEFIEELNKVQIINDKNEQSSKLDYSSAINTSGLSSVFKPTSIKCLTNKRSYGKIKISYDLTLPSNLDFNKVQNILRGCVFRIPPDMYESIIESQAPDQVYNEISVIMISIVAILSVALSIIHKCTLKKKSNKLNIYMEFESILYMLIPFITIALYKKFLYLVLLAQLLFLFIYFKRNRNDFNWPTDKELYTRQLLSSKGTFEFITIIRVALFISVYISITAVDFITFSPLLFKSKHEGLSLMDTGEGLFILIASIVSPISIHYKSKTKDLNTFRESLKKSLILFGMGIFRLIVTKSIDYRTPITEYGAMGNFFIVMGTVSFIAESIVHFSSHKISFGIALCYSILYDIVIFKYELGKLLSNNPRNTFLLMNLECLLNIAGLLPLYLFGHTLGYYLIAIDEKQKTQTNIMGKANQNQPEKSRFMRLFSRMPTISSESKSNDDDPNLGYAKIKTLLGIAVGTMLLYIILGSVGFETWRCMANLMYNLFLLSTVCITLLLSLIFTIYFEPYDTTETMRMLNKNPLHTFIYANVITGLINITIQAKLMPMYINAVILFAYSLSFIAFAYVFNGWKDGNLKLTIPEFTYDTIGYQHVELSQLNLSNTLPHQANVDYQTTSSHDGRMNSLREKLDILRTKVGRMSNTDTV